MSILALTHFKMIKVNILYSAMNVWFMLCNENGDALESCCTFINISEQRRIISEGQDLFSSI